MRQLATLLSTLFLASTLGCGSSGTGPNTEPDAQRKVAISDVGELLRTYQVGMKKAPKTQKDLERYEMGAPSGFAAVRKKDVVVQWGVTLPDLGEEPGKIPSEEVLAYEKDVPTSGGLVLLLDRTVKTFTADEFKAAKKAGGADSSAK